MGLENPSCEAVESYYLETGEGLYFAVKGQEHPHDRRIAVLRYAPDPESGKRHKDGVLYRRLYRFSEQEDWIRKNCPQYSAYDPVFQTTLQSVPVSMIRRMYSPILHFEKLLQSPDLSPLEDDAVAFLSALQKESAVPFHALGITGSMLIGMHTDSSDIDAVVFGEADCLNAHKALRRLLDGSSGGELRRLDAGGMKELYAQRVPDTKMEFRQFAALEKEKANQGLFRERAWFVRFIKNPAESWNKYGDLRYAPLGRMTVQASVADDSEAIFTPCRYLLAEARSLETTPMPDPREIVSFRGRFCGQASVGDRIMATGTLEQVQDSRGKIGHRLLLGNSPEDTMVVLR